MTTQGSPVSNAPSMIPSIRRTSTNEASINQSPAPPPSPNLSSTSFTRSLRSLLPFGPNKPATPVSASVSPRSPFASFGSVRKSMTRDRKASETLPPVMAISRLPDDPHDETGVRRSFSCSQLEEKQRRNQEISTETEPIVMPDPIARPPDADLSTIIEADTSGISNQVPTPACSRSHSPVPPAHSTPVPVLSTLPASPITKLDPDASFNLSALDPDLAELLSPRRQPAFDLTPSPSSPSFPADSFAPPPSSLPRLRPGNSNHADTGSVRRTAPPSPLANSTSFSPPTRIPITPTHMNQTEPPVHSRLSPLSSSIPRPRPSLDSAIARPAYPRAHPSFEARGSLDQVRPRASPTPSHTPLAPPSTHLPNPSPTTPNPSTSSASPAALSLSISRVRARKRSMSVQERLGRAYLHDVRPESSLSARTYNGESLGSQSAYSPSVGGSERSHSHTMDDDSPSTHERRTGGVKTDRIGPLTAKAFRAAGLLDFNPGHEGDGDGDSELGRPVAASVASDDGGCSHTSAVTRLAPPAPIHVSGSTNRSPNASGRLGFGFGARRGSESISGGTSISGRTGVGGRRGSESISTGGRRGSESTSVNGSPTVASSTTGSASRDTPRSVSLSTAPTSVGSGASSFGAFGREWERERTVDRDSEKDGVAGRWKEEAGLWKEEAGRWKDEVEQMKEKHSLETGALLGALSDSQRTTRVLREENVTLRSQLDATERDNMGLKRELGELKGLVRDLEDRELRGIGHARGFGTGRWKRERDGEAGWNPRARDLSRLGFGGSNDNLRDTPSTRTNSPSHFISREVHLPLVLDDLDFHPPHPHSQPASSTPNTKRHRRMSTASSVSLFPVPPANMTMLLHDNAEDLAASTPTKLQQVYHPDQQQPPGTQKRHPHQQPPSSLGRPIPGAAHTRVTSTGTGMSISPTTVDFSMTTGSPGSLFLRPEHEVLLGDMESLDLGRRIRLEEDVDREEEEGWDL